MNIKKREIERICKIAKWNPSDEQVELIFHRLVERAKSTDNLTIEELQSIVSSIEKNTLFSLIEGIDNSDLKTLLILAQNKK